MEPLLILTLVLTVVVGLSLGLLGGGGSILMVPLLTYVAGMEPSQAITASLVVVGVTSAVSVITHARHGRVQWRTGLLFGAAGMVGAFLGGLAGGHLPGQLLMIAFAVMMLATAGAMIRGRKTSAPRSEHTRLPVGTVLIEGLVVGLVTGIVGAGGGFLVVPALVLLGGLPMAAAVGTSLLVIALKSLAGVAGYLTTTVVDWPLVAALTVMAVAGSLVGARLQSRIPEDALRRAFGWFVVGMGVLVLALELPAPAAIAVVGVAGLALAAVLACRLAPAGSLPCPAAWGRGILDVSVTKEST